jgi:hypothetical protein
MKEALSAYASALDQKPPTQVEHGGGSSHLKFEIVYRLHASRLKCLLVAAVSGEDERSLAEEEALRLTETNFYSQTDLKTGDQEPRRSERVWKVLTDIVAALAQCRLDQSFFHRSVYRHAQALMWAPVLCEPETGWIEGSRSTLRATKSHQLRGLNHATSVAKSALAVMNVLFEKKR